MGLRGPGAKPLRKATGARKAAAVLDAQPAEITHPWASDGLALADRVILFVESLPVTAGALEGTQFRLRSWQREFVRAVYATDEDGRRTVRTAVLSMGRKNGKSDIATRLALAHLAGPAAEPRGEVYSAANDRFQASRIFNEMVAIIERVPWLSERVSIRRHSKELEDIGPGGTRSTYAALSADTATKHGLSSSMFIYDELGQAPSRDLWDVLDTAGGARASPLGLAISTQAARDDAPLSELIDYGLRVQRGEVTDPTFHLTLYSASKDADPWAADTWAQANPALGDFRSLEDVRRLAAQAQRMPSREASFRNLILNQRVDATAQFLTAAVWSACCGPVDLERLKGRLCYAGLDLGASRDLSALVLTFKDDDGGFDVLPFFWLPDDDLREREDTDRAPYPKWRDDGHLLTTPGRTTDPRAIARKIAELHGLYNIRALAFDRWRVEDLRRELDALGCDVTLVEFGQGYRDMSPAVDLLERLAVEGALRTGAHPVVTWCAANAKTVSDPAGNRKLDKSKSTGRIDGIVALAMALGAASRHAAQPDWEPMVEVI